MEAADGDQGMEGGGVLRGLLKRRDDPVAAETPDLPPTPPMTPARAATAAIGRTAEQLYSLPIRPVAVVPGALTLAELPELLPEMSLLAVLQGPGDQLGAIALSPEVAAALVEVQALGRVTSRPLERRKPTRSDAALCADFIEGLLSEMATEMRAIPGYSGFAGYHFLTHLEDARPLALMLEDIAYRSIDMKLRLGGADAREGRIMLILPQGPEVAAPVPMAARSAAKPAAPRPSLAPRMQDAPVELQGILCRRTMSLGELRGVLGGKLLYLPKVALQDAQLETSDGQILARGKLGEAEGCHALRLLDPAAARPAPDAGTPLRPAPAPVDLARPDPFRPDQGVGLQDGPGRETA